MALILGRVWPPLDRWLDPDLDPRLWATALQLLDHEADRAREGTT